MLGCNTCNSKHCGCVELMHSVSRHAKTPPVLVTRAGLNDVTEMALGAANWNSQWTAGALPVEFWGRH